MSCNRNDAITGPGIGRGAQISTAPACLHRDDLPSLTCPPPTPRVHRRHVCLGAMAILALVYACQAAPEARGPATREAPRSLPTASPTPALPGTLTSADPAHDVASSPGEWGDYSQRPDPDQIYADIVSTRFQHTDIHVRIRVTFTHLQRPTDGKSDTKPDPRALQVLVNAKTDERVHREIAMWVYADGVNFLTYDWRNDMGGSFRCAIDHHIDYSAKTISLEVPRTCYSNPQWVRLSVIATADLDDRAETYCVDDALRRGLERQIGSESLTLRLYPD